MEVGYLQMMRRPVLEQCGCIWANEGGSFPKCISEIYRVVGRRCIRQNRPYNTILHSVLLIKDTTPETVDDDSCRRNKLYATLRPPVEYNDSQYSESTNGS